MTTREKMEFTIKAIIYSIITVWLVWFAVSWLEVVCYNTTTAEYSAWNLFEILTEGR